MLNKELGILKEMQSVDDLINASVNPGIQSIEQVAHHVINAGGKRIRPAVLLTAYNALNGDNITEAIPLAAALELIHTGTLVHDDINDKSCMRRGIPTAHTKFGTADSLLTGDYLFIRAIQIVNEYEKEIRETIVDSCITLVTGEILQSHNINNVQFTEKEYLEVIEKKTASSISACAEAGGIISGGSKDQLNSLKTYGLNLGIGFQIIDDLLDVIGTEAVTGKNIGNDLCEGKTTILSIYALNNSNPSQKEKLQKVIVNKDKTTEEIFEAIEIIKDVGSVEYARNLAEEYGKKAKEAIKTLPDSNGREKLELLVDFAIYRNH